VAKINQWLEPDGLTLLEGWARDGLTDEQIASNMGINVATLYRWKKKECKICEALKKGKEVVDIQVENALLKRALGYDYQEQKVELSEKDGKKVVQTMKHVPPDTTAQIFWLKNRRPEKWRDKPIVDNQADLERENNLLEQIGQVQEEVNAIPELEPPAESGHDVVETG
jgi:hypothetical protein